MEGSAGATQSSASSSGLSHIDRTPAIDPLLGSIIDSRYLIERAVGSGGFGNVYRAVHLRFDSPVAIKVLRISNRLSDAERHRFIDLFLAEGKLVFNLGALHSSIVRVFETGTLRAGDGLLAPYLVMEWLDGVSLEQAIRRRSERNMRALELPEILALLGPCVEGLSRAHEKRVAHRDIKPGNIFVVRRDDKLTTKLLDFGLAKATSETTNTSEMYADSSSGGSLFTPGYGAPEQWLGRLGATGPWTDVYALALVCVELLLGARALKGVDRNQLMAACLDQSVRPTPRAFRIPVAQEVENVFTKALTVDPRHRYREAGEFWQALRHSAAYSAAVHSERPGVFASLTCDEWLSSAATADGPIAGAHLLARPQVLSEGETASLRSREEAFDRIALEARRPKRGLRLRSGVLASVGAAMTVFALSNGTVPARAPERFRSAIAAKSRAAPVALRETSSASAVVASSVEHDSTPLERAEAPPKPPHRSPVVSRRLEVRSAAHVEVATPANAMDPAVVALPDEVSQPATVAPTRARAAQPDVLLHHDALSRRK